MYLQEKGIEYEEKDVNKDPQARQEFAGRGLNGVPSFVIGNEVVQGLDKGRIETLLKRMVIKCESCSAKLRVPRGKGTIKVTCPKCQSSKTIKT